MGFFGWGKRKKDGAADAKDAPAPNAPAEDADGEAATEREAVALRKLEDHVRAAARRGLDIALEDLRAICVGAAAADPPTRITQAAFVTCDRADSLRRAVTSYLSSSTTTAEPGDLVVMDDALDPAARERTRAMLRALEPAAGTTIRYAGLEEKRAYADALRAALEPDLGPDAARLLEGCLFDPHGLVRTVGANRNAVLLDAAGELVTMVDDDVICRVTRTPEPERGLSLSPDSDPTEFWFFPERGAALGAGEPRELDLLALHGRIVGRSLRACVDAQGPEVPLDHARVSPPMMRALVEGDGRVLASSTGYAGDSGMGTPSYFLALKGPSFERLTRDRASYVTHRLTRAILRAARRTTISDGTFLMGACLGLDNRALLPPFSPVPRNSDGVFGVILRRCHPSGYIAQLPWALHHDPPTARAFTEADVATGTTQTRLADVFLAATHASTPGAAVIDPAERTRVLGRGLQKLSASSAPAFEEFVRDAMRKKRKAQLTHLDASLRSRGRRPAHWAEDADRLASALEASMDDADSFAPTDVTRADGGAARLARAQEILAGYGALLVAWPVIVAAARGLREAGTRLSQPV